MKISSVATFLISLLLVTLLPFSTFAQTTSDDDEQTTTIVGRLTDPSSPVRIEAPEALLNRALPVTEEATAPEGNTPTESEGEESEKSTARPRGKIAGYRVQVYSDNNARQAKTEARQRERAVSQEFPAYGTYVSYASPYWRLRVGDFRSQYVAEKAASEIRRAFPRYAREVRVVRDHINDR